MFSLQIFYIKLTSSVCEQQEEGSCFCNRYVSIHYISQCFFLSFFFAEWMHDMIDDLSRLSPIQKPSLNSRAAIVCGMSPIDLSSIFSWSIKRPAGEKIVCSQTFSVYKPSHLWLENDYHSLGSFMLGVLYLYPCVELIGSNQMN